MCRGTMTAVAVDLSGARLLVDEILGGDQRRRLLTARADLVGKAFGDAARR